MADSFEVAEGVTLPPSHSNPNYVSKYDVSKMQIGQMWFFADKSVRLHGNYMHRLARKHKFKLQCQSATMKQDREGKWTPCKPGAPGARPGCAVTRIS